MAAPMLFFYFYVSQTYFRTGICLATGTGASKIEYGKNGRKNSR